MDKEKANAYVSAVAESRSKREDLKRRFGFVPLSVIRDIHRGALSKSMFLYQQENPSRARVTRDQSSDKARVLRSAGSIKAGGAASVNSMAASTMPAELVKFFIDYYSAPGQLYLDPFMGQGVQMQVAKRLGLGYIGFDLSTEFFEYISWTKEKIDDGATRLEIYHADSRDPSVIPDGIGDFSFHSPPYWNVEYYGDEPGQLGNLTYDEFLVDMEAIYRAWLPKFKPGAFHVVNVNDIRRGGRLIPYHADTIRALISAGWDLWDLWILEGLVGGLPKIFAAQRAEWKVAPRVHEYAIVVRAPGGR
jgi:hypothetical protein